MKLLHSVTFILWIWNFLYLNPVPLKSNIPQGMIDAINQGNSIKLSQFFDENIELKILSHYPNIYSKTQAERIMYEFFKTNNPTQFNIIIENGIDNRTVALGNFNSFTGNYRIFFTMKKERGQNYIQQIKIIEHV